MIDRLWAALAVSTCVREGIDHFFVAPGSRCTPLTLAIADHADVKITQHFDERALAFAALGYARATGKAGVFVCTSGTAVANAMPAVIEASMECVPMLLFTADRPPELRGTGANQTIDQQRIFGDYPRWFLDMPCPDEELGNEFVCSHVMRGITESGTGPVHLNWMFREPFGLGTLPSSAVGEIPDPPRIKQSPRRPSIEVSGNVLVIAGGCRPDEGLSIKQVAMQLGAPLVTDITSGMRGISPDVANISDLPQPDTVVHVGGRIVSKNWLRYTSQLKQTRFIHLTPHDVLINPNHLGLERTVAPIESVDFSSSNESSIQFREAWELAESSRRDAVRGVFQSQGDRLSEPRLAFELGSLLQSGHGLMIGNSTPIRDLDWYGHWAEDTNVVVCANRGASGIDGLIATGIGMASGLERPTTIVLGDLSALHDLNSLALVAKSAAPILVLVINNHGGGIFNLLPIKENEHFDRFFSTPHTVEFEHAAAMFGLAYRSASTVSQLVDAYTKGVKLNSSLVLEVKTDRAYNAVVRELLRAEISK